MELLIKYFLAGALLVIVLGSIFVAVLILITAVELDELVHVTIVRTYRDWKAWRKNNS